jgi:HK97 family phage prohead protease
LPYIDIEEYKQKAKKGEDLAGLTLKKQFVVEKIAGIEDTKDGLKVPFIISTATIDRDNDTLSVSGWKLENYRKNPVVLWVHDGRHPPVARSLEEKTENEKLKSTALFTPQDLNPFGFMIGQMYAKSFLNAVSVGFDPVKYAWVEDKDRPWGIDYLEQELLEYSCCPVPANPEALVDAKAAGIDLNPMVDWVERVLDEGLLIPRARAEKIYSILSKNSTFTIPKQPEKQEKGLLSLYEKQIQINQNGGI